MEARWRWWPLREWRLVLDPDELLEEVEEERLELEEVELEEGDRRLRFRCPRWLEVVSRTELGEEGCLGER